MRRERRYLEMHIAAATRRMRCDADMARLQERGEPGAVWVLGKRQTHTPDCVAMAGRFWTWDVLREVNPANRHAGCGCALISEAQAKARGIRVVRGRRSPRIEAAVDVSETIFAERSGEIMVFTSPCVSDLRELGYADEAIADELLEGIVVPVRVSAYTRVRGGKVQHVREHIRRVDVDGELPDSPRYAAKMKALLAAAKTGDVEAIDAAHRELHDAAQSIRGEKARHEAQRTADRVRVAARNPTGRRAQVGTQPLAPIEVEAHHGAWGEDGTFRWLMVDDLFGARQGEVLAHLRGIKDAEVRKTPDGVEVIVGRKGTEEWQRQRVAREIERVLPALRGVRSIGGNTGLGHDAPLEIHDDEPKAASLPSEKQHATLYRNVSWGQQGDAAELGVHDVIARLKELNLIGGDAEADWTNGIGQANDAFDWVMGRDSEICYVAEVKAHGYRRAQEGVDRAYKASIGKAQRFRKIAKLKELNAERKRKGLPPAKPILVQTIMDLDNDQMFVTMNLYGKYDPRAKEPAVFTARRVPKEIVDGVMGGDIKPGAHVTPRTGANAYDLSNGTVYVGAFRLRFNPMTARDAGMRLTDIRAEDPAELDRRVAAELPRIDTPAADVGQRVEKRRRPSTAASRQAERESRNAQIVALAREVSLGKSNLTLSEIGERFGLSQGRVSQILKAHNAKSGRPVKPARGRPSGTRRRA